MIKIPKPIVKFLTTNKDILDAAKGVGYTDNLLKEGVKCVRQLCEISNIITTKKKEGV